MNFSIGKQLEPCSILRPLGYYLIFLWIFGTGLNGSLLYTFIRYKKLRQSSTNIFIGGLIFADFLGAFFDIPLPAIALINCRWIFTYIGCVLESIIAYFAGCSNMYILCLISIDRYFVMTRSFTTSFFTIQHPYIAILCAYLLALFWTLTPLVGWSTYDYEGTGASCSIKWEDHSFNAISYNITIFILVYLIPLMIIIITNVKVLREIRQRRTRSSINLNERHIRRQFYIECRVACTISFIIGGFLIAWSPYAIIVIIRIFTSEEEFPPLLATIPAIFAKTSVVWNPLIYVVRNENIRIHLPVYKRLNPERRSTRNDTVRFSVYPYSAVHLPLSAGPNCVNT